MAEDLKVVVDEPAKVLTIWAQRARETVACFRIVRWWVSIVAVVIVVELIAGIVGGRSRY